MLAAVLLMGAARANIDSNWVDESVPAGNAVRVLLIAGQSNVEGQALVYRSDGSPGTLDKVLQLNNAAASTFGAWAPTGRDASGRPSWPSREDVYVYYDSDWGLQTTTLRPGLGAYGDDLHFGVELEVGRLMGDLYGSEPVLLVKVGFGGKTLRQDFRPPSAGGTTGQYFGRIVSDYQAAVAGLGTHFPSLAGRTPVLSGFIWWQGFNDFCCGGYQGSDYSEYTTLFGHLVADLSAQLSWPASLPVVIGETGQLEGGGASAFWAAQEAVARLPALANRIAYVPTQNYLYAGSKGPDSTHRHHFYGNALSYLQIGNALGNALHGLLQGAPPTSPAPPAPPPILISAEPSPSPPPPSPSPPPSDSECVADVPKCADEGGTCACTGEVRFGEHGLDWESSCYPCCNRFSSWVAVSGSIQCTSSSFGGVDPSPGYAKMCMCRTRAVESPPPSPPPPSPSPPPSDSECVADVPKCADEGGTCACTGEVRFGEHGLDWESSCYPCCNRFSSWVAVSGSIQCTSSSFGGVDPSPGYAKMCMCRTRAVESPPPSLPPPSPSPPPPSPSPPQDCSPQTCPQSCQLSQQLLDAKCSCRYKFAVGVTGPVGTELWCNDGLVPTASPSPPPPSPSPPPPSPSPPFQACVAPGVDTTPDLTCTNGLVWDVHSRGCYAPVPIEERGCYPRAACDAGYAATFCEEMLCVPQGFSGECSSALSELHGWGIQPWPGRSDHQATRSYYGVSSYIRLFPFLGREVGEPVSASPYDASHYGYFGQWMGPYARTNWNPSQAASDANYRGSASTASIEGGLFSAAKMGKTRYPKYLAGSSTHAYSPWSDVGRGWGFYEAAVDCTYLGLVHLSNRVIVPPSGISYEPSQPEHGDDGGIFVGASWLGLPLFHATSARTDEHEAGPDNQGTEAAPMLSWTHVVDTATVRGPVIAYAPEMFTRRWVEFCSFRDGQEQTYDWQLDPVILLAP